MDDKTYLQEAGRAYYAAGFEGMKARLALLSASLVGLGSFFSRAVQVQNLGCLSFLPSVLIALSAVCFLYSVIMIAKAFERTSDTLSNVLEANGNTSDSRVVEADKIGRQEKSRTSKIIVVGIIAGVSSIALTWTSEFYSNQLRENSAVEAKQDESKSSPDDCTRKYVSPAPRATAPTTNPAQTPSGMPSPPIQDPGASAPQK